MQHFLMKISANLYTMKTRRPLIAANWKMNPHPADLSAFKNTESADSIVFPTFLDLKECIDAGLTVGGQFGHPEEHGAHTGDISMKMLKDLGCTHVLCGHSERRQYHRESDEFIAEQAKAALEAGLHPIICVGETDEERKSGKEKEVVKRQVDAVLKVIADAEATWAYEPVWAIGTGNTATPEDAQEMHTFIRSILPESRQDETRILYGGSMKPENCEELLKQPDVDGGLVGGASLDPGKFSKMVDIAGWLHDKMGL